MENFVVSARKYRPALFDSVVGQSHITTTLKNAIKNNHLAQAFLFCGPRGVGKTTCARILAKTINCTSLSPENEACNECDSCKSFNTGSSLNIHELDAASNNSVDDIRNLVEQVRYAPQSGKYKIYIIDEVHMLSQSAFNAFLKTLEEPPAYAIFILATTEKHKIIPTILSRCQIFDFNRIQIKDITQHLVGIAEKEAIQYELEALHLIAQKADGALRDALSIFDLIVTYSLGHAITYQATIDNLHVLDYEYYFKITDAMLQEQSNQLLLLFDEILSKGFDGHNFIVGLCEHFRNLLVCKDESTLKLLEVSDSAKQKYREQGNQASISFLMSALSIGNICDTQYKSSKNARLHVELALLKMAYLNKAIELARSADEIKKKTDVGSVSTPPTSANGNLAEKKNDIKQAPVKSTFKLPTIESLIEKIERPLTESIINEPAPISTPQKEVNKSLDLEIVKQIWQKLADEKNAQGKINEYFILNNRPLQIEGTTIKFSVENTFLSDYLTSFKSELIEYLRDKTVCPTLNLEYWVEKKEETNAQVYTPTEKYNYLLEKYPYLGEFKKKLDLDLDY
ncbi:MAG TPA: DNA polymerase III subunit gamma/tau [Cytophagales bacterium]|nr:DNA polymerase III subunit gamma/tau [Cytophagales bacterium]